MSKLETPLTRWYWEQIGGLLVEEFVIVKGSKGVGARRLDGLIVLGEATERVSGGDFDVKGKDVIAVQTKARRLGMSLMGQCLFSRELLLGLGVKTVKSIALCTADDPVLRNLLEKHQGCEVVVYSGNPAELQRFEKGNSAT
jgi:hypothetical protein